MKKNILFNVFPKDTTKGNEQIYVLDLKTIHSSAIDKNKLPAIQMFNNGQRVIKNEIDWNSWNNIVWVDVDSKYFFNEDSDFIKLSKDKQETAINNFIIGFKNYFEFNCLLNYYALNVSKSQKGFKALFYFNCEKSEENYLKCTKKAIGFVLDAAYYLDKSIDKKQFTKIIEYRSQNSNQPVLDKHVEITTQPFDVAPFALYFNSEEIIDSDRYGKCDLSDIDLNISIPDNPKIDYDQTERTFFIQKREPTQIRHFNHDERWRFYKALIILFQDKVIVDSEYEKCMRKMPGGTHSLKYYLDEPKSGNWFKNFQNKDKNYYTPLYLLDNFGYIYKEKDLLEYEPDEIINLNRDEYIGFYTNEIKAKMKFFNFNNSNDLLSDYYYDNIYIKADCGSGKSVFFKNIIKSVDKCIIVVHLNSIKEGVYKEVLEKEISDLVIPTTHELKKLIAEKSLPNKMVLGWDQLKLLCQKSIDISDYLKLFDEIHNVISTFNYRNKTIWPIVKNQELQHNCIIVSATNCGEHSIFCSDCYKFQFNKKPVYELTYSMLLDSNPNTDEKKSAFNTINDIIGKWKIADKQISSRKIIIFDNMNHAKYARKWTSDLALHFCKENKKNDDVQDLLKTNMLKKQLFITTTYGLEGIEIKNEIDNLFVFVPLYENNITSVDIEQLINRFRNIKKTVRVIFVPSKGLGNKQQESPLIDKQIKKFIDELVKDIQNIDFINQEEYFLDKRLHWEYSDIIEEIDPYLKHLKVYHNYIINRGINLNNIYKFYPNMTIGKTDFAIDDSSNNESKVYKALGSLNTIHEIIGIPSFDDCKEVLKNIINENELTYEDIRKFTKIRGFFLRLLEKYGVEDVRQYYQNDEKNEIAFIEKTRQYKFIIKLAKHFIKKDTFNFTAFQRFIKARSIAVSKPMAEIDIKVKEEETKYYNNVLKRLGVTDTLVSNLFIEIEEQLKDIQTTEKKRDRKKLKFQLITDENIKFHNHEECYQYLKEHEIINISLISYTKNRVWKSYFIKM